MTPPLKGFAGGALGVVMALLLWHLWLDHQALHGVIALINQTLAKQQQQPLAPSEGPK